MTVEAFAFRSPHNLGEIRELLQSHGSTRWRGGDNDLWGEYLVTEPSETQAKLRIFVDEDRFVIDVSRVPRSPGALERALDMVQKEILPLIGAYEIEPHTGWE